MPKPRILLIYTGGTIGMVKNFETGALRVFNFSKLLQRIPELKQLDCDIKTVSFDVSPFSELTTGLNILSL